MPGNTRPPRHVPEHEPPNLGTRALMHAIEDLAKTRGLVGARVAYKMNAQGQHVVAVIFESFSREQ
jgi:hypothetical protein